MRSTAIFAVGPESGPPARFIHWFFTGTAVAVDRKKNQVRPESCLPAPKWGSKWAIRVGRTPGNACICFLNGCEAEGYGSTHECFARDFLRTAVCTEGPNGVRPVPGCHLGAKWAANGHVGWDVLAKLTCTGTGSKEAAAEGRGSCGRCWLPVSLKGWSLILTQGQHVFSGSDDV